MRRFTRPWFQAPSGRMAAASLLFCGFLALFAGVGRLLFPARARHPSSPRPAAMAYRKVIAAGVPLHVVQIDLRSSELRIGVATAAKGIGHRDGWSTMVDRTRPTAALTGTYFCTKSGVPVGSIVAGGRTVHEGLVGTAFTFTREGEARLIACRPGILRDWSGFETVLRAGPRLLTDGRCTLWPRGEGFHDPGIFLKKRRTAIAITRHGKLLLIAVQKPVLLRTLAGALKQLDVRDAMCLDGGGSAGLYCRGKTWIKPRRNMTNLLVIYDSSSRYHEQAASLNPGGQQVVAAPLGKPRG
jgi:hypothetical protein